MKFTMPRNMLLMPFIVLAGLVHPVSADDTEIFDVTASSAVDARPKVVILFDDSGSMSTVITGQKPPYDPNRNDYNGGIDGDEFNRIYWSTDGGPPQPGGGAESQWFDLSVNRCESSLIGLQQQGFFSTEGAKRWIDSRTETVCQNICSLTGEPVNYYGKLVCLRDGGTVTPVCGQQDFVGSWEELSRNANSPAHVECKEDVTNDQAGNGPNLADGFPLSNVPDAQVYGAATAAESNVNWAGDAFTFYSANYVDYWFDDTLVEEPRSRMDIAKDVVSNIISANTGIDFGLAVFNANQDGEDHDGGRIIQRIIAGMDDTERANVVSMISADLSPNGFTPLCESAYEAYQYMAGEEVDFGKKRDTSIDVNTGLEVDLPERDTNAESGDNYISPTSECSFVYFILMTDGKPQYDTAANDDIERLTGKICRNWETDEIESGCNPDEGYCEPVFAKNCLPELAEYMFTHDLDSDSDNDEQLARTYTIGFTTNQDLLAETASLGGGEYFEADNAQSLQIAFQSAVLGILSEDTTFTSPAVAVDTFTRTESRDDVYYAMFKPDDRVDWRGNIKKLKVAVSDDGIRIEDKNGDPAIDSETGLILGDASTFWSDMDGGTVDKGGVGQLLANRDPATRSIYTNTGTSGALEAFNSTNLNFAAFGLTSTADLFAAFGVNSQTALDAVIAYAQGYDIGADGNSTGSAREWILGDPLHSQPLIINYGGTDSDGPDLRVVVGTNAGFLHMFGNDDGEEDWAFFPKEHVEIINQRKLNAVSSDNVYGLDLTPVVYTEDVDADGTISSSDGDRAWLYAGMRRGGRDIYALDVSNPDTPTFLWRKGALDSGMGELGWTWSLPVVTRIPGYADSTTGEPKPVVVVGAGYDLNKDSAGIGTIDSMGRGVFIFDAQTGAVVMTITAAADSATNLQHTGLVHSVPAKVSTLDSNGDELTDRLYFPDTGGNVWRVDIGGTLPSWKIIKVAELNDGSAAGDRRFFNAVDIVRIRTVDKAIDALLIGSGDRANPLAMDVSNYFYLLRDEQTGPYTTDMPTSAECDPVDNPILDFRCKLPLRAGDLSDITTSVLNAGDDDAIAAAESALRVAGGWKLRLVGTGEKSLSDSVTIAGRVAFTTYTPDDVLVSIDACSDGRSGQGALYLVDIYNGDRDVVPLGPIIPDTPSVIVIDGQIIITPPLGTPPTDSDDDSIDCRNGICNLFEAFPTPFGNYWYREEY